MPDFVGRLETRNGRIIAEPIRGHYEPIVSIAPGDRLPLSRPMVRGYRGHFTVLEYNTWTIGRGDLKLLAGFHARVVIFRSSESIISVPCVITHSYYNVKDQLYSLEFLSEGEPPRGTACDEDVPAESERTPLMDADRASRLRVICDLIEEHFGDEDRAYFQRHVDADLRAADTARMRVFAGIGLAEMADRLQRLGESLASSRYPIPDYETLGETIRAVFAAASLSRWAMGSEIRPTGFAYPIPVGQSRLTRWQHVEVLDSLKEHDRFQVICPTCLPSLWYGAERISPQEVMRYVTMVRVNLGLEGYYASNVSLRLPPVWFGVCEGCHTPLFG